MRRYPPGFDAIAQAPPTVGSRQRPPPPRPPSAHRPPARWQSYPTVHPPTQPPQSASPPHHAVSSGGSGRGGRHGRRVRGRAGGSGHACACRGARPVKACRHPGSPARGGGGGWRRHQPAGEPPLCCRSGGAATPRCSLCVLRHHAETANSTVPCPPTLPAATLPPHLVPPTRPELPVAARGAGGLLRRHLCGQRQRLLERQGS